MNILLVETASSCFPFARELMASGHSITRELDELAAIQSLSEKSADVIIVDVDARSVDATRFVRQVHNEHPGSAIILLGSGGREEDAFEGMVSGMFDWLTKPVSVNRLLLALQRIELFERLAEENKRLREKLQERHAFQNIVGNSQPMRRAQELLHMVCDCDCPVVLIGERGTGKDLLADTIHHNSTRKGGPLVKVTCAGTPRDLLERELFGYVRGTFAGAIHDRPGRCELADGGTLYVDDVDAIPIDLQARLVRLLEKGEFERVGDPENIWRANVRVIASSHIDLKEEVAAGRFREDLFYRLHIAPIELPPLRDRREDIPLLVEHFLAQSLGMLVDLDPDVIGHLTAWPWEGNVRELASVVEKIHFLNQGRRVTMKELPPEMRCWVSEANATLAMPFHEVVSSVERKLLLQALEKAEGNKTRAAAILKMKASTYRSRYNILLNGRAKSPAPLSL